MPISVMSCCEYNNEGHICSKTYFIQYKCCVWCYSARFPIFSSKTIKITTLYIFTYPSTWVGCDTRSIFKLILTGLNSELSFSITCHTKVEEPSLPYYLPIAGGRTVGFIPFPRILVLCEMQSYPGFELVSLCPFPTIVSITPQMPLCTMSSQLHHFYCYLKIWLKPHLIS